MSSLMRFVARWTDGDGESAIHDETVLIDQTELARFAIGFRLFGNAGEIEVTFDPPLIVSAGECADDV